MNYNQLKIQVLFLFKGSQELASDEIRTLLLALEIDLSDKSMKMALMRYTRQGLLARSKKMGRFHYRLTEKGIARRTWLSKN